jgi:hypothetical protein
MTHALTPALPVPPATPGFATMVTAAPIDEVRSLTASSGRWTVGALELLFVGLLVPIAILAVGAPIALVVRGLIELVTRFL